MSSENNDENQVDSGKWSFYDPPSGWRWGFPKPYRPLEGEGLADTLVRDGYPAADAEFAAQYCRFWRE